MAKEITCSFPYNYLSSITSGKLCEVVLVVTFAFDIFDNFELTSKLKNCITVTIDKILKKCTVWIVTIFSSRDDDHLKSALGWQYFELSFPKFEGTLQVV